MLTKLLNILKQPKKEMLNTSPSLERAVQQALQQITQEHYKFKSILEIGSRDGHDAHRLQKILEVPDQQVYIIEPHPHCYQSILKTYPQYKTYHTAFFTADEEIAFNMVYQDNVGTSSVLNRNDDYYRSRSKKITIKATTGKTWMQQNEIDEISFCKIDVEGATLEVLQSFGPLLNHIKMIHLECEHKQVWKGQALYSDVAAYLSQHGFKQLFFEFVTQEQLQSDSIWWHGH